jgi:hypothetical protein
VATTLLEQITADLSGKYDATFGFAESVTGPSGAFLGIFSNEYFQSDAGGYVGASSATPFLRSRDADALAKGNAVTVRSVAYYVVEVQPNGYGETIHRLQKQ